MYDRNAESQWIWTELRAVDSEYVCKKHKIQFENIVWQQSY